MSNIIYVASKGQLVGSKIEKSTKAFSSMLQQQQNFSYTWAYTQINIALFMDTYKHHSIDQYRNGTIDTATFKNKIASQLGIEKTDEFEPAWNKMCEFSEDTTQRMVKLFQLQEKEHFTLLIVSASNPMHNDYVSENLNSLLEENNLPTTDQNPQLFILHSFERHTLSLEELARIAIRENHLDVADNQIISIHSSISNLNLEYAEFSSMEQQTFFGLIDSSQDL